MSKDADIFDEAIKYVKNFTLAVDIGAHKGLWTELMAQRFEIVHAFEPNKELFEKLRRTAAENVYVYNDAILNVTDKGSLVSPNTVLDGKSRSHFVMPIFGGDIVITTLDSFKFSGCGLLKIDVEGGELPVLLGARRMLRHQKPVIVVECKWRNALRYKWIPSQLSMYMQQHRYRLVFEEDPNRIYASG